MNNCDAGDDSSESMLQEDDSAGDDDEQLNTGVKICRPEWPSRGFGVWQV